MRTVSVMAALLALALLLCGCDAESLAPVPVSEIVEDFRVLFGGGSRQPADQLDPTPPSDDTQAPEPSATAQPAADTTFTAEMLYALSEPTLIDAANMDQPARDMIDELFAQGFSKATAFYGPVVSEERFTYFIESPGVVYRYESGQSPATAAEFLRDEELLLYLLSAHTVPDFYAQGDMYRLVTAQKNPKDANLMEAISYNYQMTDPNAPRGDIPYDTSNDPRFASPEGVDRVLMVENYNVWLLRSLENGKQSVGKFTDKLQNFGMIGKDEYDDIIMHAGGVTPHLEIVKDGKSQYYLMPLSAESGSVLTTIVPPPEGATGSMKRHGDRMFFMADGGGLYISQKNFVSSIMPSELEGMEWVKLCDGAVEDVFLHGEKVYVVTKAASGNSAIGILDYATENQTPQPFLGLEDVGGKVFYHGGCLYHWAEDGTLNRHAVVNSNAHVVQQIGTLDGGAAAGELFFINDYVFAYEVAGRVNAAPSKRLGILPLRAGAEVPQLQVTQPQATPAPEDAPEDEPADAGEGQAEPDEGAASSDQRDEQPADEIEDGEEELDAPIREA